VEDKFHNMEQVRKPFIYLAVLAVVLGLIGVVIITGEFSGKVVLGEQKLILYSLEDISQHNNLADCWISSENYVYDITVLVNTYSEFKYLENSCGGNADTSSLGEMKVVMGKYKIGKIR